MVRPRIIDDGLSARRKGHITGSWEGNHKATWKREFRLPWREASPRNHFNDEVDSDQWVFNKEVSHWFRREVQEMTHYGCHAERYTLALLNQTYTERGIHKPLDLQPATRRCMRVSFLKSAGYVTKFAQHKALKLLAWGKLTFNERAVHHRVVCTQGKTRRHRSWSGGCPTYRGYSPKPWPPNPITPHLNANPRQRTACMVSPMHIINFEDLRGPHQTCSDGCFGGIENHFPNALPFPVTQKTRFTVHLRFAESGKIWRGLLKRTGYHTVKYDFFPRGQFA